MNLPVHGEGLWPTWRCPCGERGGLVTVRILLVVDKGLPTEEAFGVDVPLCAKCSSHKPGTPGAAAVRVVVEEALRERWDGEMKATLNVTLAMTGMTEQEVNDAIPPWEEVEVRWPDGV